MFVFSKIAPWQEDAGVQQVLVFSTQRQQELFDVEMLKRYHDLKSSINPVYSEQDIAKSISENGAGAIYKLRAVKNIDDKWLAIVRCGVTGDCLWESAFAGDVSDTPEMAIRVAAFAVLALLMSALTSYATKTRI